MNLAGINAGLISLVAVVYGGYLAHRDSFLTVAQMHKKGFAQGLPWIWHGGMIGDLFIVTPLIAVIASLCWSTWKIGPSIACAAVCIAVGLIAAWSYDKGVLPESHTYGGARSPTGWEHMLYLMFALWFVVMFYFATPHEIIPPHLATMVSSLLVIHIFIGTHTHLKMANPDWFGVPFKPADLVPTVVVAAILAWRTSAIIGSR